MVPAADADINATLSSWSPSRYSMRQRREKQRANKLRQQQVQQQQQQQQQKQDNSAPNNNKTLGLVNRKVLGLELVASPALLAKHSEWNFADWEERNDINEAVVQSAGTQRSENVEEDKRPRNSFVPSGGANNEFVENESRVHEVVPGSSTSTTIRSEVMNSNHHIATISEGDNEDLCPKDILYMTTTTNGGGVDGGNKGGSLRNKLTALRRLGAPTRYSLPKKKNIDLDKSLELSDSLDEPFHDDAIHGQQYENKLSSTNYTANHNDTDISSSSSSAADPNSTTVAGPAISPFSWLVKERSMSSVLDEANKSVNKMLPTPLPFASTQVQKSDAESTTTETISQNGVEVSNNATPPCTPPKLESTGVEGRTKEHDPSMESPTGVQELTLYQFFQQRIFPSCDDHSNKDTSSASCTTREGLESPRRDIEDEEQLEDARNCWRYVFCCTDCHCRTQNPYRT